MTCRLTQIIVVLLCLLQIPAALADDRSELDRLGPLASAIQTGQDGPWTTEVRPEGLVMRNTADTGGFSLLWVSEATATASRRVRLDVALTAENPSGAHAGLLFDYRAKNDFVGFAIGQDGHVSLFVHTPQGRLEQNVSDNVVARLDGTDVLELEEHAGTVVFSLNGTDTFTLTNDGPFSGTYGIMALGKGQFTFGGFTLADGPDPEAPKASPATHPVAKPRTPDDLYVAQVLLGTTLGIFWHEFGHALIGETGLPATGPEEDVADGFSAFVLSAAVEESGITAEEQAFMAEVVKYSSLLWYYLDAERNRSGKQHRWQDEHAPDLKRFRNSFCIMYGSNPTRHAALAKRIGLSERTQDRCRREHAKRYRAWETILRTVSRDLGDEVEGIYPADTPGGRILLRFETSETPVGRAVELLLDQSGVMTTMMAEMERLFVWPRDLNIVFRDCTELNAWYDPGVPQVTMCYSLIDHLSDVIFKAEDRSPQIK